MDFSNALLPMDDARERASRAEMAFAGLYLNLLGMFLLVLGVVSNLKSTGTSDGALETALGTALGVVLLAAGEYSASRGQETYSHPLLTGGFVLLFLAACSAHFRHHLMGQEALFGWLLLIVLGSNASVFRHDSKLIGHVMLCVYFLAPIFVTFSFNRFSTIFLYLLAINLGATLVAFYKKWEFQLAVSTLGSYALYFIHFKHEAALNSLLFLLSIYALSLLTNYLTHFLRPEAGEASMLCSLVSQVIFIVLSAVVVMGLPNWSRVLLFTLLAGLQGVVAFQADKRRGRHANFIILSGGSLILALLYGCVSISFVTYFSNSTTYFGLVTLLWFTFALSTAEAGIHLQRHRRILHRFSYFGLLLAAVQMTYVLPSMRGSATLQVAGVALYWAYFLCFWLRRTDMEEEQARIVSGCAVAGAFITINTFSQILEPLASTALFITLALVFFAFRIEFGWSWLRLVPHIMAGAALWSSLVLFPSPPVAVALLALAAALGAGIQYAGRRGREDKLCWVWVALLGGRGVVMLVLMSAPLYHSFPLSFLLSGTCVAIALAYLELRLPAILVQTVIAYGVLALPFHGPDRAGLGILVAGFVTIVFLVCKEPRFLQASAWCTLAVVGKWTMMLDPGPFSTLCWAILAVGLLQYTTSREELGRWNECNGGLFDFSRLLYFLAFVKTVLFDTNFVGQLSPWQYPFTFLVGGIFLLSGHLLIRKREPRNFFLIVGLLVLCFQLTFISHSRWGDNLLFQPVLSGFWSVVALFIIAGGISLHLKTYRLFGLATLTANTAKILLVDIHLLDSYSRTNTYLILGVLLMSTSLLYQRKREQLAPQG